MKIIHLEHNKINIYKWNNCIRQSFNGIVYGYSWYLDKVSDDWEALVHGDYELVMPLTKRKKYKVHYLTQPFFTQQLGVFSTKRLSIKVIQEFVDAIPAKYKYIDISLNTFNSFDHEKFNIKQKVTYELDLIETYSRLSKKYSTNTKRNIKKAIKNKISIVNNITAIELLKLKKENSEIPFNDKLNAVARRIISVAFVKHVGKIYGAYSSNNTLCASAFFISSHNKTIYLLGASSSVGKETGAMSLIFDRFIKDQCEKNMTLDFEGSNIESIARFFKGFGAKKCIYINLKRNNLPWYLRLFKA